MGVGVNSSVLQTIPWILGFAALFAIAATDLKIRIIPNELVILIALAGVMLGLGLRPGQVWISLVAAVVIVMLLGVLCHYGLLGGGDAKLVGAVSLLVPPERVGMLLIDIAIAGGLLSFLYLAAGYLLRSWIAPRHEQTEAGGSHGNEHWLRAESDRIATSNSVPYALAILGGVVAYLASEGP